MVVSALPGNRFKALLQLMTGPSMAAGSSAGRRTPASCLSLSKRGVVANGNDGEPGQKSGPEIAKSPEPKKSKKWANQMFMENRLKSLRASPTGLGYPGLSAAFKPDHTVEEFLAKFGDCLVGPGDSLPDAAAKVCGRILRIRDVGKKLQFIDIWQDGLRLQVKVKDGDCSSPGQEEDDDKGKKLLLARGDVVGVSGFPVRTAAGELSLAATRLELLAPALRMVPSGALEKPELKYRRRHLDLMVDAESRAVFRSRSHIIQGIRDFLLGLGFLEVETPILQTGGVGGACAEPFRTWHDGTGQDMLLRVAPELHLKMLVVGGLERVFEIGRQFRNEGVDPRHNPEFTSCEFYAAYWDYRDLVRVTQDLLRDLAAADHLHPFRQEVLATGLGSPPYRQIEFVDSLEVAAGLADHGLKEMLAELPADPEGRVRDDCVALLKGLCDRHDCRPAATSAGDDDDDPARLLDKLFGKLVEPQLREPTFVLHHPTCMSPLAKGSSVYPGFSERFELFVGGMELVNAYSELNDPLEQEALFRRQRRGQPGKDASSLNAIERDFLNALQYGLPPTAGWGLGVDRLVMLLTGRRTIKDVILFPTMRQSSKYPT